MTGRFARSWLFVPANRQRLIDSAFRSAADAIVFDLEDSVPADQKEAARDALRSLLLTSRAPTAPLFVRVNGPETPHFSADLRALAGTVPAGLVIPKVESACRVQQVVAESGGVPLVLLLETPRGILRALDLAEAAGPSLAALAFGAEDFCAAMRVGASGSDPLMAFAQASVVVAAAAAGVPAIDAPEMDLADASRLRAQAARACAAGFLAKFAIHPAQLAIIHDAFGPAAAERAWAERVTRAYEESRARGHGSVRVDDRLVDAATIRRARQILERRQT
ncbi:MAG: HpcH/HpaI aldolase/citrate lyase family protein [Vicinamibacterales bacterium]